MFYLSAGKHHAALVDEHLRLFSWGSNKHGQLGLKNNEKFFTEPQLVQTQFEVVKVKCGYRNTLVLSRESEVWGCGFNKDGVIFSSHDQAVHEFMKITELSDIEKIYCTNFFVAISKDQNLYMWGPEAIWKSNRPFMMAEFEGKILEVATGDNFIVVIDSGLLVYSMGLNQKGQLGFGEEIQVDDFVCIERLCNHPLKYIACGRDFCMGIGGILQPNQSKQLLKEKRSIVDLQRSVNTKSEYIQNDKHVHYTEPDEIINDDYINEENHSNYISNPRLKPFIKEEADSDSQVQERLSVPGNVQRGFYKDSASRISSIRTGNPMQKSTGFMSTNFHKEMKTSPVQRSHEIKTSQSSQLITNERSKQNIKSEQELKKLQESQEVINEFHSFCHKYTELIAPPGYQHQYLCAIQQMKVS
jgi:hypothetical protein